MKHQKQPSILQADIKADRLIPGGQAIATLPDGKKAMLWNLLPGETATEIEITKNKSSYCEGIARQINQKSPERIDPRDACYLATSPWQIMTYDYELDQKAQILREIFRQHHLDQNYDLSTVTVQTDGQEYFYRNKMEYSLYFDVAEQQIYPAFHQRGSHRKIPLTHSSLERPEIWQRAQEIINELNSQHAEARRYQSLLLRANQNGEVSGGLYENHQPHPVFPTLTDQILGHDYTYSPNGFFQINLPVYEMALRDIQRWISGPNVLDLYAGVGTIGLSVAREYNLTLVECDRSAYREMEHNCQSALRQNPHITPVYAKSEVALDYLASNQTVIFDPPRAGCHTDLLTKVLEILPKRLIYLSCNPATQARDLVILLADNHYIIDHVQPYNFFPRTPHLENLVVLTRR